MLPISTATQSAIITAISATNKAQTENASTSSNNTSGTTAANSTTVSISQQAQELSAGSSSSGSGTIDFTNMTPNQLLSTVNGLIKSGKMSLDESSALVPMMGPSALIRVPGAAGSSDPANQPVNFISTLQNGIAGAQSRGDSANEAFLTTGLNALENLQGTPATSSST